MLEKLAEIVREEVKEAGFSVEVPCIACDRRPQGSDACSSDNYCANVETPDGSLMLARWAVLLVAKGLGIRREGDKIVAPPSIDYQLLNLIAEAKKAANVSSVEEQMCQAKEDTNDAV